MRNWISLFVIFIAFTASSKGNLDTTLVRLEITTVLNGNNKPIADVSVQATFDTYPFILSSNTNQNGIVNFGVPATVSCVYLKTHKQTKCFIYYEDRLDTIKFSSQKLMRDTLHIFAIREEVGIVSPNFYFDKNSSTLNVETTNQKGVDILISETKMICDCGIKIISYSDCEEKDNAKLVAERAKAIVDYLNQKQITPSEIKIELHIGEGCGCMGNDNCNDIDRMKNRKVKIIYL